MLKYFESTPDIPPELVDRSTPPNPSYQLFFYPKQQPYPDFATSADLSSDFMNHSLHFMWSVEGKSGEKNLCVNT